MRTLVGIEIFIKKITSIMTAIQHVKSRMTTRGKNKNLLHPTCEDKNDDLWQKQKSICHPKREYVNCFYSIYKFTKSSEPPTNQKYKRALSHRHIESPPFDLPVFKY